MPPRFFIGQYVVILNYKQQMYSLFYKLQQFDLQMLYN